MLLPIHDLTQKMFDNISLVHPVASVSSIINVQEMGCYAIHTIVNGSTSSAGTLNIKISNDGINFVTDTSYTISSTSAQYMLKVDKVGYGYVKADYTSSTGSAGTLSCIFNGKKI